ncbi:hypothetical protein [Serratia odorifera]|uniref:GAF domain/diguanylate cyclase domain family protein n=1 Tax=Serratia odorifera DSM 4582 TaxID=667129 RepID=D4E688_SEROD|nr:hypothetical protein [Serratia odorifera]EFE94817.1 GAF domain/diguanylate cyclase domain family protein [Serratia odorifera DSM 4582]MBJ2064847.1 hypothetical protein [Serratia odorifera]HEJ9093717.1 hypothetical protein [Serratia odorifera]
MLDTALEERFDRITRMARRLFRVPIGLVTLVDENRQWFKAYCRLATQETSRAPCDTDWAFPTASSSLIHHSRRGLIGDWLPVMP